MIYSGMCVGITRRVCTLDLGRLQCCEKFARGSSTDSPRDNRQAFASKTYNLNGSVNRTVRPADRIALIDVYITPILFP